MDQTESNEFFSFLSNTQLETKQRRYNVLPHQMHWFLCLFRISSFTQVWTGAPNTWEVVKCSKIPVWNIPQVNRFSGNRWEDRDKQGCTESHHCVNKWLYKHFRQPLLVNSSFANDCVQVLFLFYAASWLFWSQGCIINIKHKINKEASCCVSLLSWL